VGFGFVWSQTIKALSSPSGNAKKKKRLDSHRSPQLSGRIRECRSGQWLLRSSSSDMERSGTEQWCVARVSTKAIRGRERLQQFGGGRSAPGRGPAGGASWEILGLHGRMGALLQRV
jgi:hypothetical protein